VETQEYGDMSKREERAESAATGFSGEGAGAMAGPSGAATANGATGPTGAGATDVATPPHETGARSPPNAIRIFVDGEFVAVRIATELRAAGIRRPWPALERVRAQTLKALSVDNT
jgi:hypothetical protein